MKKIILAVVGVILVGGLAAAGYWFYQKKSSGTALFDSKPKSGDTKWQYTKNITEPIKGEYDNTKDLTLGQVDQHKVSVTVPKGAFDGANQLELANPDSVPEYKGQEIDTIGAPIEIKAAKPSRLNEKAVISFQFDKTAFSPTDDKSKMRVAYFDGERWEYIKPINVDFETGIMTFETYHFSMFGATKVKDETVITENWVHSKTMDKQIRDNLNKLTDEASGKIIDMTLEKMGITDKTIKGKILADVLKDDGYKEIYTTYSKGEIGDMCQKIAILAGKKIAENVDESIMQAGLKHITDEGVGDVEAVGKAAGYAAEGQYKEAARIIGEQIADKFLITAAGKIAVEIVEFQISSWKNAEVEAAYNAFNHGANGVFYGYNVDKGDFDSVWDQMRGIRRQLEIEAIKKENDIRAESGMPPLTESQMDRIRDRLKESYKQQFTLRSEKEAEFADQEAKMKMLVEAFKRGNLLDPTFGPSGLDKGLDLENKLDVLYHFAQKMMKDTKRFDLSDKNGLIMDKAISVDDITQGARIWFSGPDGPKKYKQFLKDRFNIDMSPALKDLAGSWQNGKMKIVDVIVPEAMKNQPKKEGSSSGDDLGCDFNIDLTKLIGQEVPISLAITPQGENSGTLKFQAKDSDGKDVPFTYEDGIITASFGEKGAVATISLSIEADDKNTSFTADGTMNISYKTEAGEAKILTTLSATKSNAAAPATPETPAKPGATTTPSAKDLPTAPSPATAPTTTSTPAPAPTTSTTTEQ